MEVEKMKKNDSFDNRWRGKVLLIIIGLAFMSSPVLIRALPGQGAQEREHEPIVEEVTVTNVEVPVRVLYKGEPVIDLTKDDFTLYENKKKMKINGFFLKRKKVKVTGTTEVIRESKPLKPRTFVLVFSITDFNEHLVKAVDHLFENILKPNDRLLLLANDKTLEHPNLENKEEIKRQLMAELKEQSQRARHRLLKYINQVETYLNMQDFKEAIGIGVASGRSLERNFSKLQKLTSFLNKYLLTWVDYRNKYLTPRLDRFYYFSRYLEGLKGDKWVFSFYQFDLFPKIRMTSQIMDRLRIISSNLIESDEGGANAIGKRLNTFLNQLLVELNVNKTFPTEEVSKLFYKVDATFHSFFIKSLMKSGSDDLDYQEVASDIERTLKEITDITGGQNITSNDLVKSIETVSELEDVYYILTYAPRDPKKAGKLKIKVKNRRYRVLYDDNFRADYINDYFNQLSEKIQTPEIKIEDFSFAGKILAFTVKNYLVKKEGENNIGRMKVRIKLTDSDNNLVLFDQARVLTAQKTEMKISLGAFKTIQRGEYDFIIDAVDMFTGKEDNFHQKVTVR
jgi:hypothetical protein